jgi:hypothetical protein
VRTVHSLTWGEVDVGALVVDASGQHWRVAEKRVKLPHLAFLIYHDDVAHWVQKGFSDEVTLVDETAGQSVEVVMAALDGALVVDVLPIGPDKPNTRALYRSHLYHHHRLSVPPSSDKTGGTLAELIQLHAVDHAGGVANGVKHIHREVR